jgi:uncharacterized protein YeaO (DUF488 family)
MILTKRIYGYKENDSYYKIFVDRLWPRGISKSEVIWNEWIKDIAPSMELRKWFGHKPENWNEFKSRYKIELSQKPDLTYRIRDFEKMYGPVVLLYAAKDQEHNNANIIKEYLVENNLLRL